MRRLFILLPSVMFILTLIMTVYFKQIEIKSRLPTSIYSFKYPLEFSYHFGTKTSYFMTGSNDERQIQLPGCKPNLFWFLARHGTRNPSVKHIQSFSSKLPSLRDKIIKGWEEGKGSLNADDVKYMEMWNWTIGLGEAGLLTRSGGEEQFGMGRRWRKRMEMFNINNTKVRSSSSSRSMESASFFLDGFFNNTRTFKAKNPQIKTDDQLLRFYEHCPKWLSEVDNSDKEKDEITEMESSRIFSGVIDRVKKKLGIFIQIKEINLLWEICRFESAWYPRTHRPWCAIFSMDDINILEFREDIKYYYRRGPAFNITCLMTQPLWKDIFFHMARITSNKEQKVVLNFGPSIMPLVTSLGLYKDRKDLSSSNWPSKNHLWKSSKIGAFSSNVGILMSTCNQQNNSRDEYVVTVFHQERAIRIPSCDGLVCPLDMFLDTFRHLAEIDFNLTCAD